jgi:MSHA biogenesis protein MshI
VDIRLKLISSKNRQNEAVGVEFNAEGVAFAHIQRPATQQPKLVHCEFLSLAAGENPAEILRSRLTKLGLQRLPCHIVLNPSQYTLLLVEAPKVPAEELAEALRWRIKDLINFPAADAVIDAFFLPEDSARGGTRMAYAVVAQRSVISNLVAQVRAAQLNLTVIDAAELALRNLVETCCDTRRGVGLVKWLQGGGSLQIIRAGNLYLSRQFSLPYNGGLLDDLPGEALVLELQRSLDYFERQLRQPPPSHLYLCGENVTPDKLTPDIRSSLAVTMDLLFLNAGLQIDEQVQEHTLSLCLLALGAALRQDAVGSI